MKAIQQHGTLTPIHQQKVQLDRKSIRKARNKLKVETKKATERSMKLRGDSLER